MLKLSLKIQSYSLNNFIKCRPKSIRFLNLFTDGANLTCPKRTPQNAFVIERRQSKPKTLQPKCLLRVDLQNYIPFNS